MVYELVYFPGSGRADIIKMVAEHCGIPYEFKSIDFDDGSWASAQSSTRYGQLPYLKVDNDFTLYQTVAIARFLAKQGNFYPVNDERKQATLEECISAIDELINHVIRLVYYTSKDKKEEETIKFHNLMKLIMNGLISHLRKNNGYLIDGGELSWADLYLFDLLATLDQYGLKGESIENSKQLETLKENVLRSERIKSYWESNRNLKKKQL